MDPLRSLAAQGAMIERLSSDSRRCAPGVAFLAYPGEKSDGRAHIQDAVGRGASAVLWEQRDFSWNDQCRVPNVPVADLKQQAGVLAHEFYGRPSEALWVCGVTGTNGKTSCSQWLAAALGHAGAKAGVIGTLGSGFPGALAPLPNTTPDALELHSTLKQLRSGGAKAVAMEVSSHGLVQGRVNGVRFACALFTNLSHDHLDYHGSMQAYGAAKARLFETPDLQCAVLNLDDELGVDLAKRLAGRVRTIGYSLTPREAPVDRAIVADERVRSPAPGRFNLSNALGVIGCLLAKGIAFDQAARLVASLPPVPGRMQTVGDEPLVVVDYAHTPDALDNVLRALRPVASARGGRLAVVFGAGGDRDPSKRAPMGAIAAQLADRVLITSDNPRSEDPAAIIEAVRRGAPGCEAEVDRARAIERVIRGAKKNDVVLIAGKGHENYQEIAGRRTHFSDEEQARAALTQRKKADDATR
ncbi:MAG TPA: UDP-N-acetylmuramoyl-L-alanyl-D-glutamate--2,6-diaminopimelate ligase [Burkholderiales bacterium]